ncbi:MAG: glycosyltransferase family 2 protein [Candidatus Zixiibacteriota bacterium]
MNQKILVAVVTFNEGEKLAALMDRFPSDRNYDLLFVDDGSSDGSSDLIESRGHTIIRHVENLGVGASLRDAIAYGRANNYGIIVIMAGNGKMLPEEIPRLVTPLLEDRADYVQGSRNLHGGQSPNLPLFRRVAIKLFTLIVNVMLRVRNTDVTCGFRAYRLGIFDNPSIDLNQDWLNRYELEYYLHYKVLTGGYRFVEVPVSMVYPKGDQNYSKIKPLVGWWSMLRPWVFLMLRLKK